MKWIRRLTNIMLVLAAGCIPPTHAWWTTYTVPAGEHYSLPRSTVPLPSNTVRWEFKTNDTWRWEQPVSGLSKVGGIFFGASHYTSVRIGFQNWKGHHELWYYIYEDGESPQESKWLKGKICDVEIPGAYEVTTGWRSGKFIVELSDTLIEIKTAWRPNAPAWLSAPYIGGSFTIDQKWKVPIKLIK